MKQIILAVLSLTILACSNLLADFQGPIDIKNITTVAEAQKSQEDTKVVLTGNIIKKINDEHYTFKDKTGEINVEIDDDKLQGINITPETSVTIYGEIDKDDDTQSISIDIDRVQVNTVTAPK